MQLISDFRGVNYTQPECYLPDNQASIAENVDLRFGTLRPWMAPCEVIQLPDNPCSAAVDGCNFCGSCDPCMEWLPLRWNSKVVRSTPNDYPAISDTLCGTYCRLGCPTPLAPSIMGSGACDVHSETRVYVITYGDAINEGAPSPVSNALLTDSGSTIAIALPTPPTGWCVDTVRIYRLMSTWDTEQALHTSARDSEQLSGGFLDLHPESEFFLLAELPIDTVNYVDNQPDAACGDICEALTTWDYVPPLCGLCIIGETETGSLVGIQGQDVWFSARYNPHVWNSEGCIHLGCDIRGAHVMGGTVFVMTEGYPFIIEDDPGTEDIEVRNVRRIDEHAPLCNKKAMAGAANGVIYASSTGLVFLSVNGVEVLSRDFFGSNEWSATQPDCMSIALHKGQIFMSSPSWSGILDIGLGISQTPRERANLTTLSICPQCWLESKDGQLYFLDADGRIFLWEGGYEPLAYHWKQALRSDGDVKKITAAKVQFIKDQRRSDIGNSATQLLLYSDDDVRWERIINHSKPMRTCVIRGASFNVEVTGTQEIKELRYGAGLRSLSRTRGG